MPRHRARPLIVAVLAFAVIGALPAAVSARAERMPTPTVRGAGTQVDALLVRLQPGVSDTAAEQLYAAAGATRIGRLDPINTVVLRAAGARSRADLEAALVASPLVQSVERDGVGQITISPNDRFWPEQWAERKIRSPRAWDMTRGDSGAVIAILDTGVKRLHDDLAGRVMDGYDFVQNDGVPSDDNGHGTLVAGVAAARGNNQVGVAGTCWLCRIMPVKVANRGGAVRWSNAAAGIIWATDRGADVINMSFGDDVGGPTLAAAVEYARNRGVVLVASAGNNGNRTKLYPAAYPGVLSVAATNSADTLYSWSTRGEWVKLAAPGCTWTTRRSGGYGQFCGTSASAPIVAGVAGLVVSLRPGATRGEVVGAIVQTAVPISGTLGGGRVDAYSALLRISNQ